MEQQTPVSASEQQACDSGQQPGVQRYSDEFMMYVFKVEMCKRVDKHDREECPYAHPGELARRRHPSLYKALPCPEARAKKICPRLENCNCSHSTFEFWLHPDRFKTFLCERGANCNRPICFFAHDDNELRELPQGLHRPRSPHKPSAGHSSSAGGAGSSRQAAAAGMQQQAPGTTTMVWVPAAAGAGGGSQMTYVAQQGAPGYGPQQQQPLQAEGSEQGSQMVMSYVPVMQQQGAQQQQGMQYVAMPVQQGGLMPDAGLGAAAAAGPTSPQMQLLQQGQVLYAPAGDGQHTPRGAMGQQQQPLQLQYMSYPPQQLAYGMQPAPQGQYGAQYGAPGRQQQITIGYQPVHMGGMQGYSSPQGVLMVRPAPQRGATVAVIPAGPSAWSGSLMSAESGACGWHSWLAEVHGRGGSL
ncbi:hypothetical protein OEZ86_002761 [Tetradesmus obliquus]|nr:hypothetical protein OEZ86_002761 [Tetradesmus obliquus]